MAKHDHQLGVEVNSQHVEKIRRKYEFGTLSREVRKLIEALAEGGEYETDNDVIESAKVVYEERLESGDYPEDWGSRRKDVFLRDGYQCQNCGSKGGSDGPAKLVAHHIVPANSGGNHYMSNLATLCIECHNRVHSNEV